MYIAVKVFLFLSLYTHTLLTMNDIATSTVSNLSLYLMDQTFYVVVHFNPHRSLYFSSTTFSVSFCLSNLSLLSLFQCVISITISRQTLISLATKCIFSFTAAVTSHCRFKPRCLSPPPPLSPLLLTANYYLHLQPYCLTDLPLLSFLVPPFSSC